MKNKKQFSIILFILVISGFFMFFMSYNSFVSDKKIIDGFDKDVIMISLFNRYVNKFDYLHGFWLIPTGIFFIMLLVIIDFPSFEDIFKRFKKDLLVKLKEKKV